MLSDLPTVTTGYGLQGASLARRLAADGHRVFIYAPGGMNGGQFEYAEGITVLSSHYGDDRWGNTTYPTYADTLDLDLVITLLDAQGLLAYGCDPFPTVMWAAIDTWPVPKQEQGVLGRADRILVPSQWGLGVLRESGLDGEYVPYGIESKDFYFDAEGRRKFRQMLGVADDQFLVGMVGLNTGAPDRKGYPFGFEALKTFFDEHPNAVAYVHTNPAGDGMSCNLEVLRETMGLEDRICFPRPTSPINPGPEFVRHMYSAFDVLLQSSMTEGFGLPIIEAQATGCPVVLNAATAMPELLDDVYGWAASPAGSMWMQACTQISIPNPKGLANGLALKALDHTSLKRTEIAKRMRSRVVERFDWDMLYARHWRPLIESIPGRVEHATGRKLNLGCGTSQMVGAVNHDRTKHSEHVDVAHDLNQFPWPFSDNSFDFVQMTDVIEHLTAPVPQVMDELWRIIAPNGWLALTTCERNTWQRYEDPTHTRGFTLHSFDYFDPETNWGKRYGCYSDHHWRIGKRMLQNGDIAVLLAPRKEAVTESTQTGELAEVA